MILKASALCVKNNENFDFHSFNFRCPSLNITKQGCITLYFEYNYNL